MALRVLRLQLCESLFALYGGVRLQLLPLSLRVFVLLDRREGACLAYVAASRKLRIRQSHMGELVD
eukprot:3506798-Pleurochrysis_carterae.AAC.1